MTDAPDELQRLAALWRAEDSIGTRTVSTASTQVEDTQAMLLVVADLVGLPKEIINYRVLSTWRDGILIKDWFNAAVPDDQPIAGVWL